MTNARVALLLSSLVLPFVAPAETATDITCERFPDADAVTVDEVEKVKYNPDGTYEQTDECWTKILTEKGRREESTLSLDYSKRYGEAAILYVGAIGADGKEREIDVSATTKEQTDNSSMAANIYDPLDRKVTCTIPGLKIGETLHVKMRRKATKARCEGKWADISVMEWSHPIVRSTYEVTAPPSLPLRKIAIRHPLGNVVTNVATLADGSLVHTFTATNSAQAFPEPDMPPLYTQVQNVRVSTATDWPEISKWYWELCAPHLAKTNAAMVAMVGKLTREAGSGKREEAMRRIFKFVSQEVRYMGLTMEDTSPGYAPHDVDITFDNRYGVCRDKAGLLVAMLRLAGFKAFPVLIHVGAKLDPEVPQPFFNHAIVAVEANAADAAEWGCAPKSSNGAAPLNAADAIRPDNPPPSSPVPRPTYLLMDPTDENAKDLCPSYLCDKSYLVARPEGETLLTSPVPPPESNAVTAVSSGALMKDGSIFLENEIRFDGINDTAYRHAFVRRKPEDRVKFFEQIVRRIVPGAELIRCDVSPKDMRDTDQPVVVRMASKMPEAALRGESQDELNVPFVTKALGMVNFMLQGNTSLEQRKYPLTMDSTACVRETLTLDLAGELGAARDLPEAQDGGSDGFRYVRRFAVTNGTLTAERTVAIGAVEFSPEQYAELREDIKRMEAAERKRPSFGRDPLKEADVRLALDRSETTVTSDRTWVTTNEVVKEILTYEGKKRSAEMKIPFNPAVETVEIVSATVSNRDGKVSAVSAKERNVMDCGWAAAAPRYPAGKLLVVNFPSVEIGSVISYVTVRAVTNAPASFYASYAFDAHEPLERRIVRVNDWRREVVRPRRLPNEPNQPAASFWRDCAIVSSNDFAKAAERLADAVDVEGIERPDLRTIRECRDWMAKYVKVAGPGLYELPIGLQATDPATVLKERYATRFDYVRTLCALLRGAGYDADVVLAASDADEPEEVRNRIMREKPNVRAFAAALCRVRVREGGFWGFGGEAKEYFVGTENQYAPIGPSSYAGCDYFDPASGEFGIVGVPSEFADFEGEESEYVIRENGAVDLTVENVMRGVGVGGFRKTYSEILPEERSRRYQAILGAIAQAASATSDLETDVESYPARRKFSCFIPDFATVQGETISIQIPPLVSSVPSFIGNARQTPFAVGSSECEEERVTIRFPEGYAEIESLPKPFAFANPLNPAEVWLESAVSSEVRDGALVVTLSRKVRKRPSSWYGPNFYELIKDWGRIVSSRANRTVKARRK